MGIERKSEKIEKCRHLSQGQLVVSLSVTFCISGSRLFVCLFVCVFFVCLCFFP